MRHKVFILHLIPHQFRGAVQMRCHQLADIGERFLDDRYDFHVRGIPGPNKEDQLPYVEDIRDSIVILSKSAVAHVTEPCFRWLKDNNIAVAADWIDRGLKARFIDEFDMHIAASYSFLRHVSTERPGDEVRLLTHHADLRLASLPQLEHKQLKPLYLGHPDNLPDWPDVNEHLTIAQARKGSQFSEFLPRLPEFNMHYNVRPIDRQQGSSFKPLTKGFTAAACGANMLVQRDVDDALDYLGADYPYLLPDGDEVTALEGLAYAYESYGTLDWRYGLSVMREVAERSSPGHIAAEFDAILSELAGKPMVLSAALAI